MKKILTALLTAAIATSAFATGFDFRTTGTTTTQVINLRPTSGSAPPVSDAGWGKLFLAGSIGGYSAGNFYISQNGGPWTLLSSFVGAGALTSWNTRVGAVVPVSGDYSVGQVTGAAPLASPTFTGVPAAPTAGGGTNTTQIATTAFVQAAVGSFAPINSPTFTGVPAAPTAAPGVNTTQIATTAFVATSFAPLASPTFTGTPAAPTAAPGTNTTQVSTTAFVQAATSANVCSTCVTTNTIQTVAALKTFSGAILASGTVGGSNFRTDAAIEATGTTNGIVSCADTTNPGTTTNECAYVLSAYDSAGNKIKKGSISAKHVDATATTGYAVMRLVATYAGGATDDGAIRIFGNHGVALWAADDTSGSAPGAKIFKINGSQTILGNGTVVSGTFSDFIDARNAAGTHGLLFGYDTTGFGVIAPVASDGLTLWTFNGSAWGERVRLDSAGKLGIAGTPAFPLHVFSATANQFVGEFDATHRIFARHDGTNGYFGTSTNQPLVLRTNNTDAITVSTSQQVGINTVPGFRLDVGAGGTGTNEEAIRTNSGSGSGGRSWHLFSRNSVVKGYIGVSGAAGNLIAGDAANDFGIVSSQKINLSTDGGTTLTASLDGSGNFTTIGTATATRLTMTGTAGVGYLEVLAQSSNPAAPATGLRFFASSAGAHAWKRASDGFVRVVDGTLTADRTYTLPDVAMTFASIDTAQTISATKTFSADQIFNGKLGIGATPATSLHVRFTGTTSLAGGNQVEIDSNSSGKRAEIHFTDGVTSDAFISFEPSATAGSRKLHLTPNGVDGDFYIDGNANVILGGKITSYAGVATVAQGIPPILTSVALTGQNAAIGSTNLLAAPTAGTYRVCYYHEITTAATSTSSTQLTIGWTAAAAKTKTGTNINTNTLGDFDQGCFFLRIASGALTYSTTYASTGGTGMQYGLNISVERVQ